MKKRIFFFSVFVIVLVIFFYTSRILQDAQHDSFSEGDVKIVDTPEYTNTIVSIKKNETEDTFFANENKEVINTVDVYPKVENHSVEQQKKESFIARNIEKPIVDIEKVEVDLLNVEKIWDKGGHNAFTGLVKFRSAWYCVFREGSDHLGRDGKIRILKSNDGNKWLSIGDPLAIEGHDLRDPN